MHTVHRGITLFLIDQEVQIRSSVFNGRRLGILINFLLLLLSNYLLPNYSKLENEATLNRIGE